MNTNAYLKTARKIPDNVRTQRLIIPSDPIDTAIAVQTNYNMQLLQNIWYKFIEPSTTPVLNCPTCLQNILNNFREMKGALIRLEKEYQLLKDF